MKYRAFLAIYPSSQVIKTLESVVAQLRQGPILAKWTDKSNFHLTLKFFGSQSGERIYEIQKVIEEVLPDFKPFTLQLKSVSVFPKSNPKIISADIENSKELINLQKAIDSEVSNLSFVQGESRSFLTHITLGRIKGDINKDHIRILDSINLNENFEVSAIHLMESDLTGTRPHYSVLQSYQL